MKKTFIDIVEERKDLISAGIIAAVSLASAILGNASFGSAILALCGFVIAALMLFTGRLIKAKRDMDKDRLSQQLLVEKAQMESQLAASFDYKMSAPVDSPSFVHLADVWRQKYGVDLSQMNVGDVRFCSSEHADYICAQDFLNPDMGWNSSFSVMPLRNADKQGKCIVQVSFIPCDENGKIPIILRMPACHTRDVVVDKVQKAKLTFVSFSPVPLFFNRTFAIEDCYHREVPDGAIVGVTRKFDELGFVIKREKDGRYYLFYVFSVRYSGCSFSDDNGNLNKSVVDRIFAVEGDNRDGAVEYFVKDHDKIIAAAKASDIDYVVGNKDNIENAPQWLRDLFSNNDYRVEIHIEDSKEEQSRTLSMHFDMTTAALGNVEKKIVQKLLV